MDPIDKAVAYIEANLSRRLTLEDVAGQVGYSPYHFLRLFWAVTGETPGAYIRNRRLAEAARLLTERSGKTGSSTSPWSTSTSTSTSRRRR
jgi:AraC-like DNA-binding protein